MAFDGVPIGFSDGLPEPRRLCLGRSRVWGCHPRALSLCVDFETGHATTSK